MIGQELEEKWKIIGLPKNSKYTYQRIDSLCIPELRIGLSSAGNRCVILKLKSKLKFTFHEEEKENLKTYYDREENSLVLELIDPFYDLFFTDLVVSLYNQIHYIQIEDESTKQFINTVGYWSDFLKAKRSKFLSVDVVQGLYGELVFLEYLIDNSSEQINYLLSSWRGPYDSNQDFHFIEKNIEVKTKRKNSNIIHIASEFQLDSENGKELELAVVTVDLLKEDGDTLMDILNRIRDKTLEEGGLVSIISDAIAEKKLSFINVSDYNSMQFRAESIEIYDCDHAEFPKLIVSELNESIHGLSYKLALNSIEISLKVKTIEL